VQVGCPKSAISRHSPLQYTEWAIVRGKCTGDKVFHCILRAGNNIYKFGNGAAFSKEYVP
jgi:hypothetical protein